jgi:hypothetical protein
VSESASKLREGSGMAGNWGILVVQQCNRRIHKIGVMDEEEKEDGKGVQLVMARSPLLYV